MKLWCCVGGQVKHYVDYQLRVDNQHSIIHTTGFTSYKQVFKRLHLGTVSFGTDSMDEVCTFDVNMHLYWFFSDLHAFSVFLFDYIYEVTGVIVVPFRGYIKFVIWYLLVCLTLKWPIAGTVTCLCFVFCNILQVMSHVNTSYAPSSGSSSKKTTQGSKVCNTVAF